MQGTQPQHRINKLHLGIVTALLSVSTLSFVELAHAQQATQPQAQPADTLDEITVTGSRIRMTSGMETPNPVTVVSMEQISLNGTASLADGLAELPQFNGSNTTANPGGFFNNNSTGALALRGLASKRTLNLLSGRRIISSTITGGPDINMFPTSLLRSVETVTGGATSAYGTDAVAGAVNFILNTNFTGYKASFQKGQNYNSDNKNYTGAVAGGWEFLDNGHLLLSFEQQHQDAVRGREGYDWYTGRGLLANPSPDAGKTADNPLRLPYDNIVSRTASYDGIINFPAASKIAPYIVDPNGVATPFVVSDRFDANFQSITNGGSGVDNGADLAELQPETGRQNFFGYTDYDLTPNLNVFGQLIYGKLDTTSRGNRGLFGGIPSTPRYFQIYSGNPFLPANIQKLMTDNNVASVNVGRIGHSSDVAIGYNINETEMTSVTTGFKLQIDQEGFFKDWAIDSYFQKGSNTSDNAQDQGIRIDRIYLAADAVKNAAGQTVCNVTNVSGQYRDCVPFNPFGRGQASPAAVDWVTGFDPGAAVHAEGWLPGGGSSTIPYDYIAGTAKKRIQKLHQDVFELSANGELFDGFGAGPISMAIGYDWRHESYVQYIQAPQGNTNANLLTPRPVAANNAALGIRGVPTVDSVNTSEIQFSKVGFGIGDFQVREGFTEFNVPLLADLPFIKMLNTNLAARWAKYDGSGDVWSWKIGLEWRINEQVRMRGTVSQDVRAANLGERYDISGGAATITDLLEDPAGKATSSYGINALTGGNPNVKPEQAKTFTAGIVYQPTWLDGLQMSADWYNVDVGDNITQLGSTTIVNNCYRNNDVDACALIVRDGPASTINPAIKRISLINDVFVNVSSAEAQGIDIEASYRTDIKLFGGDESFSLRYLGSKLQHNTRRNSVGVVTQIDGTYGFPGLNQQFSGTYTRDAFSASLQARFEKATTQSYTTNVYQASLGRVRWDVLENSVPSQTLLDGSLRYRFDVKGDHTLSTYLTVNNITNEDPLPNLGSAALSGDGNGGQAVGNGVVGSLLGRRYTVGVNFDF
jgi:iron complex outermembrane recepter protein